LLFIVAVPSFVVAAIHHHHSTQLLIVHHCFVALCHATFLHEKIKTTISMGMVQMANQNNNQAVQFTAGTSRKEKNILSVANAKLKPVQTLP